MFLFIINPISGVKDNKSIAQNIINILNDSNLKFDVIHTSKSGYAKNYVFSLDKTLYHSIIILGGDGTINEVINGIL